jgi:hypothetical protein
VLHLTLSVLAMPCWEMRSVSQNPFALFETFGSDVPEEERERRLREMEKRLKEKTEKLRSR